MNLTLSIDRELLQRARIKALEEGTSVNALVRDHLTTYVGGSLAQESLGKFLATGEKVSASSGKQGRSWKRAEIYER